MKILFPERMKDITIIVHDDYVEDVMDALHRSGTIEISDVDRDRNVLDLVDEGSIPDIVGKCTNFDMKFSSILDVFNSLETEEEGMTDFLKVEEIERVKRKKRAIDVIFQEAEDLLEESGKRVLELDEQLNSVLDKIEDYRSKVEDLRFISSLDIDLGHFGESDYTVFRVGKTTDPSKFKKAVSNVEPVYQHIEKAEGEEDGYVIIAGTYIRKKNELDSAIRLGDARPFSLDGMKGGPKKMLQKLELDIKKLEDKRDDIIKELKDLKNTKEMDFLVLKEEIDEFKSKKEVEQKFGMTDSSSIIKAWTPSKKVQEVKEIVSKSSRGCAFVSEEDPEDPDEVPVSLDNPKMIKPFELLTNMFAPPRYDEIDPTIIIAPAFVVFFGLMLGDAIYGALIVATGLILLKTVGRVEEGTRDFSFLLLAAGISTVIFGILQGGYFGPNKGEHLNLLGRLGIYPPVFLNTLEGDGPLILLLTSLVIGLIYINLGIFLSLVQHIKRRDYKHIIIENVSWWLLEPGAFILLTGMLFKWFTFSSTVYMIAGVMTIAGLALLVVRAKGLSFFEITGFIGDLLSFTRILALGLATGGIALTVNVITNLVAASQMTTILALILVAGGGVMILNWHLKKKKRFLLGGVLLLLLGGSAFANPSYPFYILGFFVLLGGHLINAVLQALGSFVHSLRLQYVEFFGYFYSGGGDPFTPFKPDRIYTELEDVKK